MLSHEQCQRLEAGVSRVTLDEVARIRGGMLIDADPEPLEMPDMLLLAISKGQRPTPGYSLEVDGPGVLEAGELTINIVEARPDPGAIMAQVMTHPCLVVGIADDRNVASIRVVDRDDGLVGEHDLSR